MTNERRWTMAALLLVPVALIASALFSGAVNADSTEEPSRLDGEMIGIRMAVWTTAPEGGKRRSGTASMNVRVGERGSTYLSISEGGCAHALGSGSGSPETQANADHFWTMDALVVEATMERIELEFEWQRLEGGEHVDGDRRTVALDEGESHVIDFVRFDDSPDGRSCALNGVVELEAFIVEDPELRDTRIRYDLWLSDESPDGGRQTRRIVRVGGQGETLEAEFEPLRWRIPRWEVIDGSGVDVVAEVVSALRGRLRRDGTLDLSLGATRWLGVAAAGEGRSGGIGDGGRTLANVTLGEPIQLVLPTPAGSHLQTWDGDTNTYSSADPNGSADGVTLEEDGVRVAFEPFFRNHTMSLILTATID